jgi:beta-lactamase class A
VRPATDQQIKRIQALRDKLKAGGATTTTANAGSTAAGAGQTTARAAATATPVPTATPAATATPKTTDPKLAVGEASAGLAAKAIAAARTVAGNTGRIGISGRNLVSGQRIGIAADQTFPSASVGKLGLLIELYRETAAGTLTLNQSQQADLRAMIIQSDNDAANRLLEVLSAKSVNANLKALGLIGTQLVNPFGLAKATGAPANVTTPADMARLMEMLANEQIVNAAASREMRSLLLQTQDGSKLRRGLPAEARIAHKSGWYDGVANDVGIISQGQTVYVLSVFTEGIPDAELANKTIAAVAEAVHGAWGPTAASTTPATTSPASLASARR